MADEGGFDEWEARKNNKAHKSKAGRSGNSVRGDYYQYPESDTIETLTLYCLDYDEAERKHVHIETDRQDQFGIPVNRCISLEQREHWDLVPKVKALANKSLKDFQDGKLNEEDDTLTYFVEYTDDHPEPKELLFLCPQNTAEESEEKAYKVVQTRKGREIQEDKPRSQQKKNNKPAKEEQKKFRGTVHIYSHYKEAPHQRNSNLRWSWATCPCCSGPDERNDSRQKRRRDMISGNTDI